MSRLEKPAPRGIYILVPFALLAFAPSVASADTVDAASCSQSDVQSALDGAQDGDTVMVPTGACTWSSPVRLSNDRGVTLMCAAMGGCEITADGTGILLDSLSGDNDHLYRISGLTFHTTGGSFVIWLDGNGTMSQIRIDHNAFADLAEDTVAVFFGDTEGIASYFGVIDHNTVTSSASVTLFQAIGATDDSPPPSPIGTANNIFIEDNSIEDLDDDQRRAWLHGRVGWSRARLAAQLEHELPRDLARRAAQRWATELRAL